MSMTAEAFEQLVRRMEVEASKRPLGYKCRVFALAVLPYLYVFGALALALALIGVLIASVVFSGKSHGVLIKLAAKGSWALGMFVFAVLRALRIRAEPPQGNVLEPGEHPKLFEVIEEVRKTVKAPRAHVVMLDDQFNAAIAQHSRLGLLGWQKNYLYLGLPLLRAMSPDQVRAVLAHEFGHLAGAHGRVSAWIYRSRMRWSSLLAEMEKDDHWASFVFRPFFRWYSPHFNATSFVLARSNEYDADRSAAEATSPRVMGDALLALRLRSIQLDEHYWPQIRRRMDEIPEPDVQPHTAMRFAALEPATAHRWLDAQLEEPTGVADTHPSLPDRLAALGVEPRVPPVGIESAAEAWFGDALPVLAETLDAEWRGRIESRWREHYIQLQSQRDRLAGLETSGADALSVAELWEYGELVEMLRGSEEALPLYAAVHERDPEHVRAEFHLGRLLLARGEATGLAHIERCIAKTESAIVPGSELAVAFLRRIGNAAEAERWSARGETHQQKLDEDEHDRSSVWLDDRYAASNLTPESLEALADELSGQPEVARAWVVQRRTLHYPERPMYVLVIRRKRGWSDLFSNVQKKAADLALQNRLAQGAEVTPEFFVIVTNHRERRVRRLLEGFPGTQILPRPRQVG